MNMIELTLALLALLISPGPTNALLALAGAQEQRRDGALLGLVLMAYLATVVPLTLWGQVVLGHLPALRQALTIAASIWVGLLAFRLWRRKPEIQGGRAGQNVTATQVFMTTLLNPKALVFGLVLLPKAEQAFVGIGVFALLVLAVSALWLAIGARLGDTAKPKVNKLGAAWLAALSLLLIGRALAL